MQPARAKSSTSKMERDLGERAAGSEISTADSDLDKQESTSKSLTDMRVGKRAERKSVRLEEKEDSAGTTSTKVRAAGASDETSNEPGRVVHFNDRVKNEEETGNIKKAGDVVTGNLVTTSKYTLYTLLPLNLSEQFSKLANVYFLIISLLQLFTPLSPTSKYSTAGPLALVLAANLIREMWEDSRRHADDATVNNRTVQVVTTLRATDCRRAFP